MNKKILSMFLVFCLILNFVPAFSRISNARTGDVIKVRIEGKNRTLFDKEVTVTNEVYGYDLLKTALGEDNIDSTYYENWDAYFINGLLGETGEYRENEFSTDWMYYAVKGNQVICPMVAINNFEIEDVDELVMYISASDPVWNPLTYIPTVDITNIGNQYEISVQQSVYAVSNANVDVSYIGKLHTDQDGKVRIEVGKGIYDVIISKGDEYPEIVRQHLTIEGEDSYKIKGAVEDLQQYYKMKGQYSFREALALNFTSRNISELKDIKSKYRINEGHSASAYAGNIIGLIASGNNPRDYNGQNFVEMLANSQNENGKFIVSQWDDYPTTIAYSIIALDMAEAQYDVEGAVNALMNFGNDGNFGSVDDTAISIMALANHKDVAGVTELIDQSINYLKEQQLSTGGFEAWGAENPYSIAAVIQALVANGIDPLGEEWVKNGNTMLDALLKFKEDNYFKYTSQWGTDIDMATEQAFTALADLYRGRSMFQNIREFDISGIKHEFTVNRTGNETFYSGQEAKLEVNIKNNTEVNRQVTFIVVLYDKDEGKMVNYTYLTKILKPFENEDIAGGFLIPESGNFEVKGFLWDNMNDMNALAEPVVVKVE